jgi:peptide deformylase
MRILRRTQFGNTILREITQRITKQEILSTDIQYLLKDMRYTLVNKRYGVGLAAPQIGKSLAIAIIGIKPTPTRPNIPTLDMTLINPEIVANYGKPVLMWEGCISGPDMYGKTERYEKVRLKWLDEKANSHEKIFDGLVAQVIQHENDHLNGILFVERVVDPKSYVTFSEYKKMRKLEKKSEKKDKPISK